MDNQIRTFVLFHPELEEEVPPPLVHGDIAFAEEDYGEWALFEATVDLISEHYGFERELVWAEMFNLELEVEAESGLSFFGRLLERPWGFTVLGIRVAQALLGEDAAGVPSLSLVYH